jgi:ABC-2 type transport system ATP-binding protein
VWTFQRVTVRFGDTMALNELSFRLEGSRIFGIVGPDGAGKSTLLKLMAGLVKPSSGGIRRAENLSTGFVSEHFGLYEEMSVMENLQFYGSLHGLSRAEIGRRAKELLIRADLDRFTERLAGHLSGGMKRKLAIIAAVLHRPSCLILDEPTHGVDPVARKEIWNLIGELNRQEAMVIVSTQYLDEVPLCDEVLLLHKGRVLAQDSPGELISRFPYRVYRIPEMREARLGELKRLKAVPGVVDAFPRGVDWIVLAEDERAVAGLNGKLEEIGHKREIERIAPEFEDVFIQCMGEVEARD